MHFIKFLPQKIYPEMSSNDEEQREAQRLAESELSVALDLIRQALGEFGDAETQAMLEDALKGVAEFEKFLSAAQDVKSLVEHLSSVQDMSLAEALGLFAEIANAIATAFEALAAAFTASVLLAAKAPFLIAKALQLRKLGRILAAGSKVAAVSANLHAKLSSNASARSTTHDHAAQNASAQAGVHGNTATAGFSTAAQTMSTGEQKRSANTS